MYYKLVKSQFMAAKKEAGCRAQVSERHILYRLSSSHVRIRFTVLRNYSVFRSKFTSYTYICTLQ